MVLLTYFHQIILCAIVRLCVGVADEANTTLTNEVTIQSNITYNTTTTSLTSFSTTLSTSLLTTSSTVITEETFDDELEETWLEVTLRDIAFYLRGHKFNEWDRRYFDKKPLEDNLWFYEAFPTPRLKSLHWEVQKYCSKDFFRCISYLHKVIKRAPFTRNDDLGVNLNKNSITLNLNLSSLRKQNNDCKRALLYAERTGLPFGGPQERFIWRTSASYYMCWYTMKEHPALSMLGEPCDNFANCLDVKYGNRNHDPRANDVLSFACAMYSFCPDPCCSLKHVNKISECYNNPADPCYKGNSIIQSRCNFERKYNQNFDYIMDNLWNISCSCHRRGFRWDPRFGMCIDIDECATSQHNCNRESEDCLNEEGTFQCVCKYGFIYEPTLQKCIIEPEDTLQQFNTYKNSRRDYDLSDINMRDKWEAVMNYF